MEHKFHVNVKSIVDRILMMGENYAYLGDMVIATENESCKIFNGTVKTDFESIYLICLGGEGKTKYKFNDLFSVPMALEGLKSLSGAWRNMIIVNVPKPENAPQSIKQVLIEFPLQWQKFIGVLPVELLKFTPLDKIKLPGKHNASDYLAIGVDINADTWMRYFDLVLPDKSYMNSLSDNALDKLLEIEICVGCYIAMITYKFRFDTEEITSM